MWKYILLSLLCLGACSQQPIATTTPQPMAAQSIPAPMIEGRASFYGGWHNGRTTSSGMVFNSNLMTAAHRSLPFGTKVIVTNLENSQSCNVEITDRGPAAWTGRVIDVSEGAARCLHMIRSGVVPVKLQIDG